MNDNKIQTIIKIFNNDSIRTVWNSKEEKYYISVVDVVSILSESNDGRKYWNKLKQRMNKEGNESVTNCHQLKLKSSDGKYYNTDVADIEGIFRLIQSIPSRNAEPFKLWLASLGNERIDETFNPSIAIDRAISYYQQKGYDNKWIESRIRSIIDRKELTDIWKEGGITDNNEYAILTNEIYKTWTGMTAGEYKEFKGIKKENLRDNMSRLEVLLTDISEETTKQLAIKYKPYGLEANKKIAIAGGETAKVTRHDIEKKLGENIIKSNKNLIEKGMTK